MRRRDGPGEDVLGGRAEAGGKETGIRATRDDARILELGADCVASMPRHADVEEVCTLLRAGLDVICTPFLFHPAARPRREREPLAEACAAGGSSVAGTGIHPGFVGMVLPLALSGMSRSIRRIRIQERADWTYYDSPRITFDNMRFGAPPERATLDANPFARFNAGCSRTRLGLVRTGIGLRGGA